VGVKIGSNVEKALANSVMSSKDAGICVGVS
jgi:hypothetical protein